MLLRLLPEMVSKRWDYISGLVESALPEEEKTPNVMTNILNAILQNSMGCWVSYDPEDENHDPHVMLLMTPAYNALSETQDLLVYAYVSIKEIGPKKMLLMRKQAMEALGKYMQKHNFKNLVGYTPKDATGLLGMVEYLGGKTSVYWRIPIGEIKWAEVEALEQ